MYCTTNTNQGSVLLTGKTKGKTSGNFLHDNWPRKVHVQIDDLEEIGKFASFQTLVEFVIMLLPYSLLVPHCFVSAASFLFGQVWFNKHQLLSWKCFSRQISLFLERHEKALPGYQVTLVRFHFVIQASEYYFIFQIWTQRCSRRCRQIASKAFRLKTLSGVWQWGMAWEPQCRNLSLLPALHHLHLGSSTLFQMQ